MTDLQDVLDKQFYKEASDTYGPTPGLIEQTINALRVANALQKSDPNLLFFGGTAAQFSIPDANKRASKDVDLICSYNGEELSKNIKDTVDKAGYVVVRGHSLPVAGIGMNIALKGYKQGDPYCKVDIVCNEGVDLAKEPVSGKIFGVDIPTIMALEKESIFSRKLVTLDLDGYGLKRQGRTGSKLPIVVKQIYDLYQLRMADLVGYPDILNIIETNFENEKSLHPGYRRELVEAFANIISSTKDFWKISYVESKQAKEVKDWDKASKDINPYLPKLNPSILRTTSKSVIWGNRYIILLHFSYGVLDHFNKSDDNMIKEHFNNAACSIAPADKTKLFHENDNLPSAIHTWSDFGFWCLSDLIRRGYINGRKT